MDDGNTFVSDEILYSNESNNKFLNGSYLLESQSNSSRLKYNYPNVDSDINLFLSGSDENEKLSIIVVDELGKLDEKELDSKGIITEIQNQNNELFVNREYGMVLYESTKAIDLDYLSGVEVNYTGKGVKIAVLDTGIDESHEFLQNTIVDSVSFIKGEDTTDYSGHGTHVAGIISGNNKYMSGVAPDSEIVNIKVLNMRGSGSTYTIVQGINYAIESKVDIISISIGAPYSTPDRLIDEVIGKAINAGIVVVVASGNCGSGYCSNFFGVMVPGSSRDVITVGAVTNKMEHISFSAGQNFEGYLKPDVVAPGKDILSSIPNNKYLGKSGTSMATPHITGIIALLLEKSPELSHFEVKELLKNTAIDLGKSGKDVKYGYGFVKASDVLNYGDEIVVSEESSVSITPVYDLEFDENFLDYEFGGEFIINDIEIFDTYQHKLAKYSLFPDDFNPEIDEFESFGVYGMSFESHEKFMYFIYQMLDVENDENNIEIINFDNNYLLVDGIYYWYNDRNQVFYTSFGNVKSKNHKKILDTYSDFTGNDIGETKEDNSQKQFSIQELVIEEDEAESLVNFIAQGGSEDEFTQQQLFGNPGTYKESKRLSFGKDYDLDFDNEKSYYEFKVNPEFSAGYYYFYLKDIKKKFNLDLIVKESGGSTKYSTNSGTRNEKIKYLRKDFNSKDYKVGVFTNTYPWNNIFGTSATIELEKVCIKQKKPEYQNSCYNGNLYGTFQDYSCNPQRDKSNLLEICVHAGREDTSEKTFCSRDRKDVLEKVTLYNGICQSTYSNFGCVPSRIGNSIDVPVKSCANKDMTCHNGECIEKNSNDLGDDDFDTDIGNGGWKGGGPSQPPEPPETDCRKKASLCSSSQFCGQQDGNCYAKEDKCTGSYAVTTLDSSNSPVSDVIIKLLASKVGETNNIGYLKKTIYDTSCNYKQTVTATCSNGKSCKALTSNSFSFTHDNDSIPLKFDCSVCVTEKDLSVDLDLVTFNDKKTEVCVRQTGLFGETVDVKIYHQDKEQNNIVGSRDYVKPVKLDNYDNNCVEFSLTDDVKNNDLLHVWVDPNNRVKEFSGKEYNNYVLQPYEQIIKVFVDVNMDEFTNLNLIVKDYIGSFVDVVDLKKDADLILDVGININLGNAVKIDEEWISEIRLDSHLYYDSSSPLKGIPTVFVNGKYLTGTLSGLKKLISFRHIYFNLETISHMNTGSTPLNFQFMYNKDFLEKDIDSLGVRDLVGLSREQKNSNSLNTKVKNVLFNNNYELEVHKVKTLDSTSYGKETFLRIKNIKSDYSTVYKNALNVSDMPIVMGAGLWNNLNYWETGKGVIDSETGLADRFVERGNDVWEIELTGGLDQEQYNYNYSDITEHFFPTSIASILKYTNKNKIQYVGFSNGCGTALASMNKFQKNDYNNVGYYFNYETGKYEYVDLNKDFVDTFVGLGCPGTFNSYSWFGDYLGRFGDQIVSNLETSGFQKVTGKDVGTFLNLHCILSKDLSNDEIRQCNAISETLKKNDEYTVSVNLLKYYLKRVNDETDMPQVNNLNINNFKLFVNKFTKYVPEASDIVLYFYKDLDYNQDVVVSTNDSIEISNNIVSVNTDKIIQLNDFFHGRTEHRSFISGMMEFLK